MATDFVVRHIGPTPAEQERMLADLGLSSLDALIAEVVPEAIRLDATAAAEGLPTGCSEAEALAELQQIAAANQVCRSLIGLGYHDCVTPALLQRHVFETRPGTPPTPPIRRKSARAASRPCSTTRP